MEEKKGRFTDEAESQKSLDEEIHDTQPADEVPERVLGAGNPALYRDTTGLQNPAEQSTDTGEAERVLELERKAVRSPTQRG
jgi:uncharacterized protein YheU (UPF0270 family)